MLSPAGEIREVVIDTLGLDARPGQRFDEVVHSSSTAKARRFVETVVREQTAVDWELVATASGTTGIVRFSGVFGMGALTVVGATSTGEMSRIADDLGRIGSEQATMLRAALKDLSSRGPPSALLDDLTRLNNELGTAQRELARKNAELARIDAQKDLLLGMVSHDLRNPIAAIGGLARLLSAGIAGPLTPQQTVLAGRIEKSTVFMRALIDDLLDLSAIESGKVRLETAPFDLAACVRENVEIAGLVASEKGIAIEVAAVGNVEVVADERKIQQVISNLLSNAIKYSWPDSRVLVVVRADDERARVEVADRGQGIPVEEQTNLFRPFGRTSVRATSGEKSTGLGLAIARRILEAHGGQIGLESTPGAGSTFFFELPRR